MTRNRRKAGARFKGRRNGLRVVGGSLVMASVIATGIGIAASGVAGSAVRSPQWAGPNDGYGTASSLDWAGYGVSAGTFTKVAGSWVQPKATCPAKPSEGAAFWVGIDGLAKTDKTVEQIGTDSDCVKGSGPSYYAWYEMYPKTAVFLPQTKYPVMSGETIAAEVSASGKTRSRSRSALRQPAYSNGTTRPTRRSRRRPKDRQPSGSWKPPVPDPRARWSR